MTLVGHYGFEVCRVLLYFRTNGNGIVLTPTNDIFCWVGKAAGWSQNQLYNPEGVPDSASTTWASHRSIMACSYETSALVRKCRGLYSYDYRDYSYGFLCCCVDARIRDEFMGLGTEIFALPSENRKRTQAREGGVFFSNCNDAKKDIRLSCHQGR
eukprot:scaffold14259_cov104-Cylindrotheca_fusiformis.AAC.2